MEPAAEELDAEADFWLALKCGSIRDIRSPRGGCVANIDMNELVRPLAKKKWLASSAFALPIREPSAYPPIFFSAPAIPSGFLVNCTADASARNSRCRETALLISLPKKTPM